MLFLTFSSRVSNSIAHKHSNELRQGQADCQRVRRQQWQPLAAVALETIIGKVRLDCTPCRSERVRRFNRGTWSDRLVSDALYEELHRSTSMADVTVKQIDDAYANIMREFQEQRAQLLQRVQHTKEDMRQ